MSRDSKRNRKTIRVIGSVWLGEPNMYPSHWEDACPVTHEELIEELTEKGWWIPGQGLVPGRRAQEILQEDYCICCGMPSYEDWLGAVEDGRNPDWGPRPYQGICGF